MSRPSRLVAAGLAALVAIGVLSGCSVSDEQIHPGLAAQVGDEEITINDLDEVVGGACAYFTAMRQDGAVAQPRGDLRSRLLTFLMQRAVAEQLLAETGAELDPSYQANLDSETASVADAPADQRDGYLTGSEALIYIQAAQTGLGAKLLADEGVASPDDAAVTARGVQAFADWVSSHDIEVNPLFAVGVDDGVIVTELSTETSVAASEFGVWGADAAAAVAGAEDADPADVQKAVTTYVDALPADQACG